MKYLAGFMILFLFACKQENKNGLPEEWYRVEGGFNNINDSAGFENMVLRLYDDGTYSRYAANFYNYGTWQWNKAEEWLTLQPVSGDPIAENQILQVSKLMNDQLKVQKIKKEGNVILRSKQSINFLNNNNKSTIDPFSRANNIWRIKPTSSETPSQIKDRTVKYLEFLKMFYQHALDNDFQVVTSGWYPAPLQMNFSNGFRMAYNTEVKDWYACFYNEQEGIEAYKMLAATVHKTQVHHIENKAERNIDIIEQILKVIELPKDN